MCKLLASGIHLTLQRASGTMPAMPRAKGDFSRKLFGLRLREDLLIELRHVALDLKRPANQLLEEAIQEWLKNKRERSKEKGTRRKG